MLAHSSDPLERDAARRVRPTLATTSGDRAGSRRIVHLGLFGLVLVVLVFALTVGMSHHPAGSTTIVFPNAAQFRHVMLAWMQRSSALG